LFLASGQDPSASPDLLSQISASVGMTILYVIIQSSGNRKFKEIKFTMAYDKDNVFAKILRGEIPCKVVYEDDHVLCIHDAFPKAPVHVLILPRGPYISMTDFTAHASEAEMIAMQRAVGKIVEQLGLADGGYRVIANTGEHGGQEVPHLHWHVVGGGALGPMLTEAG
jgi:diadenosine tetraphosphate (Ap4A) HIT family hydrolase